jgi:hypothetical protein
MIDQLVAGDTLNFTTAGGDYPASAGWSLAYKLIPRTSGSVITITSSASGDDHLVQAAPATTAAWAAGTYSWVCYASKSGERQTLQQGTCTIRPDPGVVTTLDNRSSARKALDAMDAALETYGAKAYVKEFEIAGRRQSFGSPGDFMAFRSKLQAEVRQQDAAADIAAGRRPRNQILARFNTR